MRVVFVLSLLVFALCETPLNFHANVIQNQTFDSFERNSDTLLFHAMLLKQHQADIQYPSKICHIVQSNLNNNYKNLDHVWKLVEIGYLCGCSDTTIPDSVAALILDLLLNSSTDPLDRLWAARIAQIHPSTSWDDEAVNSVIESLLRNVDETDAFVLDDMEENGSYYYLGHVLELISRSSLPSSSWNTVWKSAVQLFNRGGIGDESIAFYGHSDSSVDDIESTVTFIHGLYSVIQAKKLPNTGFSSLKLCKLVKFLTTFHSITPTHQSLRDLGISTFKTNTWKLPILTYLSTNEKNSYSNNIGFRIGEEMLIYVFGTTVWGEELTDMQVSIGASREKGSMNSLRSHELLSRNSFFLFNFSALKPTQGKYIVEVNAQAPSTATYSSFISIGVVRIFTDIVIRNTALILTRYDRGADDSLMYDNIELGKSVAFNLTAPQDVTVRFEVVDSYSGLPFKPQKAVIACKKIVHERNFFERNFFAFQAVGKKSNSLSALIDMSEFTQGTWELAMIVGDPYIGNPLEWKLATIHLIDDASESQSLSAELEFFTTIIATRPTPSKFQNGLVGIFTVLIWIPLALFIVMIAHLRGFKLSLFPTGINALYALAFHLSFIAVAYVMYKFWLCNNIFVTLKYLIPISLAAALFGLKTLRAVFRIRVRSVTPKTDATSPNKD